MPTPKNGHDPRKPKDDQTAAGLLVPVKDTHGVNLAGIMFDRSRTVSLDLSKLIAVVLAPTEAQKRLAYHRSVLEAKGISDLSALGKLSLAGALVPSTGLTTPGPAILGPDVAFQGVYVADPSKPAAGPGKMPPLVKAGGLAKRLIASPIAPVLPVPNTGRLLYSMPMPVTTAYLAAEWLDLADGTIMVLKPPVKYLVIIAEKVTVGANVSVTWERPTPDTLPVKQGKPAKQSQPPVSTTIARPQPAPDGTDGAAGGTGPNGWDAPVVEIWTLDMAGHPVIDLRGQDGFPGGAGQDGGDGADGAKGRPDAVDSLGFCTSGPGNGGNGGNGGRAGDGGQGGNGGAGGAFSLYAPQPAISAFQQQFYVTVDGGQGGGGGIPGVPGAGGAGGPMQVVHGCNPAAGDTRTAGASGQQGAAGHQGPSGQAGPPGQVGMTAIDPDDFRRTLEKPALISFSAQFVKQGDWVTATGLRFSHTDTVLVNGRPCTTRVSSDTTLTFQVPAALGGTQRVEVRQPDGTLSNPATIYVLPTLAGTTPSGRIRPGTTVTVTGTGFAPGMHVRVNDQDMPNVQFVDEAHATFTLVRPATVQQNPAGEPVTVKVLLGDGTPSNPIALTLDTLRILVLGDSIAWGQGLMDNQKFSGRVEAAMKAKHGDIGVYRTIAAHSGATLGLRPQRDNTMMPAIDGEVPTSYPTIAQQADTLAAIPDAAEVDLILLDGGINDVDVRNILNPTTSTNALKGLVTMHCHDAMLELLKSVRQRFPKATIVVSGYYQILSSESDQTRVMAFCLGAGLALDGIPGAVTLGVLGEAAFQSIVTNCATFASEANKQLQMAVNEANAAAGGTPQILFADPMFTPANAALAPNPFVYGINLDFSPEDDVAVSGPRGAACQLNADRSPTAMCERASVGHPNPKGAAAYASVILSLI